MPEMTASQIQRLGERLRREVTPEDLALLRQLREGYRPVLDAAVGQVRSLTEQLGVDASLGTRPAKTTRSILAKLHRERTNLSRMQDIAGCRVVVPRLADQDAVVGVLRARQPAWKVDDLREHPHYGYRAVHLVTPRPMPVEIQVRTLLQQLWASVSEGGTANTRDSSTGTGPRGC